MAYIWDLLYVIFAVSTFGFLKPRQRGFPERCGGSLNRLLLTTIFFHQNKTKFNTRTLKREPHPNLMALIYLGGVSSNQQQAFVASHN
jgi:hypothetical protein